MDVQQYTFPEADAEACRWGRETVAQKLAHFDELDSPWTSQSQIAGVIDVPRTTLQYWLHQRETLLQNTGLPSEVVGFFESPRGLAFLHQLVTAAHLVFVQANDCGIRNLCWFLELSQLDAFVAASYGAQRKSQVDLRVGRRVQSDRAENARSIDGWLNISASLRLMSGARRLMRRGRRSIPPLPHR